MIFFTVVAIALCVFVLGLVLVRRGNQALHVARKHSDLMSAVVEQSPAGVAITDALGNIKYVNPAFQNQTGYSKEELLGNNPRVLKSGIMPDEIYTQLWETITAGGVWLGELCNKRKNGDLYWENASIGAVRFEGAKVTYYAKVSEDITRRKEAEEKATSRQSELAHLSRVHTLQQMTGELAHEIHQPLCAILSAGQATKRLCNNSDVKVEGLNEALEVIVTQSERAGQVVHSIRNFSRKNEPYLRPFNLLNTLEEVLVLLDSELKNNHVTCVRDLSGMKRCQIIGDPLLVEQVLVNLCRNAVGSMVESGCCERIIVLTVREQNKEVKVSVGDTGIPIEGNRRQEIFIPFFTTRGEGLGIGLSLCRSIVDSHGGQLWLEDKKDEGNVFSFTMPMVAEKENS